MPPNLALGLCAVVTTLLLWVERRRSAAVSWVVWVPTCWMLIAGSRPVGRWLTARGDLSYSDGSSLDRLVLVAMLLCALVVLFARRSRWSFVLKDHWGVILLFTYMGLSILWSDYPFISFKRWIRSAGIVLMALVILSERDPLDALRSVLRRCAVILIPVSIVLSKYFPLQGRLYSHWSGMEMWTGVTTSKNSLAVLCALSAFFLIWDFTCKRSSTGPGRNRWHIAADGFVLACALYLLSGPESGSYSATSTAVGVMGVITLVVLRGAPGLASVLMRRLRIVTAVVVVACWAITDAVFSKVAEFLGRDPDLTGRTTEIWPFVWEAAARHPWLGAGYGGAWGIEGGLSSLLGVTHGHNGYLDTYLELGIIGLVFLSVFFFDWCRRIRRQYQKDADWGLFGVCLMFMVLPYNVSETAFFDVYIAGAMILLSVIPPVAADVAPERVRRMSVRRPVAARTMAGPIPAGSTRSRWSDGQPRAGGFKSGGPSGFAARRRHVVSSGRAAR